MPGRTNKLVLLQTLSADVKGKSLQQSLGPILSQLRVLHVFPRPTAHGEQPGGQPDALSEPTHPRDTPSFRAEYQKHRWSSFHTEIGVSQHPACSPGWLLWSLWKHHSPEPHRAHSQNLGLFQPQGTVVLGMSGPGRAQPGLRGVLRSALGSVLRGGLLGFFCSAS